jgi:hypothetical protein
MVPDVRMVHGRLWLVVGGTSENPTLVEYVPPPRSVLSPSWSWWDMAVLVLAGVWLGIALSEWFERGEWERGE